MFNKANIKLIALDLDGTLTQHKQPIEKENFEALKKLNEKYSIVMAGAGLPDRIFNQIGRLPFDIVGNYGLQYAKYNADTKNIDIIWNLTFNFNEQEIVEKINTLRQRHGFTEIIGDSFYVYPSGCFTVSLLGLNAPLETKLKFDPDKKIRRSIYKDVCDIFSDYNVFLGGSSSFDMVPKPYNKYHALDVYCKEKGIAHSEVLFIGDDYGLGGNDQSVYLSDINFLCIDDYRNFPKLVKTKLL